MAKTLLPQVDVVTMSSVEIADLTKKNHKHVMADIRTMLEALEMQSVEFSADYKDSRNRSMPCFKLPRDLTETLITGYNTPLRHKVILRLSELEAKFAKPSFKVPTTLHGALLLAAELEQQRAVLTHQVEVQVQKIAEDAPKVEVYHKIADSTGLIGFQKFCTQLNLKQKEVKHWMREIGWLRAHQYAVHPLPTAVAVDAGYCKIRNFTTESGKLVQRIWFTGKAITYATEKAPGYIRKEAA